MLEDFWGSWGLCNLWLWQVELKSLGCRLRQVAGIVGNLLAESYRGDSNWNLQNWGPSDFTFFLKQTSWEAQKPWDLNFPWHRRTSKNHLWLFQVGYWCTAVAEMPLAWCTLRVTVTGFTGVYSEEPCEDSHGMSMFWSLTKLVVGQSSVTKCISFHPGNLSDQYPLVIFGPSPISTTAQVSIPQLLDLTLLQHLRPHLRCRCGTQWQRRAEKWDDSGSCWKRKMERWNVHIIHPYPFLPVIGFLSVHCIGCVLEAVDRRWNATVRNCRNEWFTS